MSKKVGKQDIMARILDGDILKAFENIIIPDETQTIEEILEKYGIVEGPFLKERLEIIKILCVIHNQDFPNVVERMILDEGLITKKKVPSKRRIKAWFEKETR